MICVGKKGSAGIYSHADLADLADFLFRYYYVVHECTTDLRNLRNLRGKKIFSVDILTQISQILVDNFCKEPKNEVRQTDHSRTAEEI